uniref:Uncharacterized protein n=1 Tax=Timema monikensis TaxID=170555 RepID=A0A7R9EKK9_9NEOP|nr:unnamed protein product [Timema monikensis]
MILGYPLSESHKGTSVFRSLKLKVICESRRTTPRLRPIRLGARQTLIVEQRALFESVMEAVQSYDEGEEPRARAFFVDGPEEWVELPERSPGPVSLPFFWKAGRLPTVLISFPVPLDKDSVCNITVESTEAQKLKECTGKYGMISPRSSLALHHGIDVLAGVIDKSGSSPRDRCFGREKLSTMSSIVITDKENSNKVCSVDTFDRILCCFSENNSIPSRLSSHVTLHKGVPDNFDVKIKGAPQLVIEYIQI